MEDFSRFGSPSGQWIKHLGSAPAVSSASESVEELQRVTNTLRDQSSAVAMRSLGLDKAVSCTEFLIPTRDGQTIPARTHRPSHLPIMIKLAVFIHFHGGGYLFGTLSSEDAACARISSALQICVVNVCYRHTPEFKFPTPQNDAWDAVEWLSRAENMKSIGGDDQDVVIGGISAGASLAASVVQQCQLSRGLNSIRIRGQVLAIPWLVHPDAYPPELLSLGQNFSFKQHRDAPVLPKSRVDLFVKLLEIDDPHDPRFNPGLAEDGILRTFPKTALLVAGMDPLRDEALYYATKLARNGILLKVHVFPGLPHGFRRFNIPASSIWDKIIQEGIIWALDDEPVRTATVLQLHVEDTN